MRYITHGKGGDPDVLQIAEMPRPAVRAGEVLVEVAYAGVNRPDVQQRKGLYPPPPGASPVLGLEISGTVVALGEGVDRWTVGDRVCALTPGGGYAEFCAVPAAHCLPVPDGVGMDEAAAVPENAFTVWHNVFERGRLRAGETLLVHGGSSGIGTTAIQLASAFGATVYATVGNGEKAAACLRLGADHAIVYRDEDFEPAVRRLTDGRGVDVVLDMVGAAYTARNLDALALEGRLVQIATMEGREAEIDLARIMTRRLTLTGSTLRPQSVEAKAGIAAALLEHVWPLLAEGRYRPPLHATYPMHRADEAHALMESSTHIGKILIQIAGA
ncbi:NAD(P)H-quinone oxidoreductase [Coralloluteibacterium stylophorae]|uniref:NAD(P)H-quinone oxidoreductase n=1 Tax=Coralloluteibacterium stylophorae TaxID=1776034 RepID=A0A8J7VSQ1_9GAMM|nr:NAD(P)H-quinone oxidoreductase [Coralloluteibacterium stylophorae]MBS7455615.1 NAD(P)H-quinone oxidoreductase [Coralloluteibacterium stylophorae]